MLSGLSLSRNYVVSIEMMVDVMYLDEIGQRRGIEGENNCTQDSPCGTQQVSPTGSEETPSTTTNCCQF